MFTRATIKTVLFSIIAAITVSGLRYVASLDFSNGNLMYKNNDAIRNSICSLIKCDFAISDVHSEVAYSVLSSYGSKELVYVSNFARDESRDSDGDGIPDLWELFGADVNGDGCIDVDLPSMGSDPNSKDLFVEIDYMHGCAPSKEALQKVVDAFDDHDITLHIDAGPYSINFPEELSQGGELRFVLEWNGW